MKLITITLPHTASTLVANINTGFLEPDKPIYFKSLRFNPKEVISDFLDSHTYRLTLKCHSPVNQFLERVKEFPDANFVFINRSGCPQIQDNFSNVCILEYNKLLYRSKSLPNAEYSLDQVLHYVIDNYQCKFEGCSEYLKNFDLCKKRILAMDEKYHEIKNLNFSHIDPFFSIHGSHKNKGYLKH